MQKSKILSKLSTALHPVLPLWKRMQRPSPVALARQDVGTFLDMVMALEPLGPLGPMANCRLMTIGIRGVDLTLSQALKMYMHGVPSYHGSHVNNTTLGLLVGSITGRKIQAFHPI